MGRSCSLCRWNAASRALELRRGLGWAGRIDHSLLGGSSSDAAGAGQGKLRRWAICCGHEPLIGLLRRKVRRVKGRLVGLFSLTLVALTSGVSAATDPGVLLSQRQSILEAHRTLVAAGWSPAPAQEPSPRERLWSAVALPSLSACSGTGAGFCRFDYQRQQQRLSVVTVPSDPGQPSVGRVERWW